MTLENSYHYGIIRRAIDAIDQAEGPLSLEDLAADMGLSGPHFQRVFSAWVGVSPKKYQQYLTLENAKGLLRDHFTVLETSLATGLSGSSRLHDLFLRWEAMSPGDYAKAAKDITIYWGWFESPFGPALVMGTDRGICGIAFASETGPKAAMEDLRNRWPGATYIEDRGPLRDWTKAAFGESGEARLLLIGAPLQIKVWEALMRIPSGHVTTYSELAQATGHPRAVRAVGTAVGRNPISWIIPCHRALRKSGALGGYHWGLPVKRALLGYEAARRDAAPSPTIGNLSPS